jgi:hypothetical protein
MAYFLTILESFVRAFCMQLQLHLNSMCIQLQYHHIFRSLLVNTGKLNVILFWRMTLTNVRLPSVDEKMKHNLLTQSVRKLSRCQK